MIKTFVVAAALAGTALGGVAYAAQDQAAAPAPTGMHHHRGHGDMLAKLDADHDGTITRGEAIAAADARFARMDTNGDGQITQQEMQAKRDAMRAKWQQRHPAQDDQSAPDGQARPRRGHHGHGMMLKQLDANSDGIVTRAEAEAAAIAHFDRFDTNHDGRLDATEIAAAKAKMQARMADMRAKWQARRAGQSQPEQPADQ